MAENVMARGKEMSGKLEEALEVENKAGLRTARAKFTQTPAVEKKLDHNVFVD